MYVEEEVVESEEDVDINNGGDIQDISSDDEYKLCIVIIVFLLVLFNITNKHKCIVFIDINMILN